MSLQAQYVLAAVVTVPVVVLLASADPQVVAEAARQQAEREFGA